VGKPPAKAGRILTWVEGGKFKETTFSWDEVCRLTVPLTSSATTYYVVVVIGRSSDKGAVPGRA
jgi:hypothetical protein